METTAPISGEFPEPKSIGSIKSPYESANVQKFPEFIARLQALVTEAQTLWLNSETDRRTLSKENETLRKKLSQLRTMVGNLKNKQCHNCLKLAKRIHERETELKQKNDVISVLINSGLAKNHHSYNILSQMVNNTVGEINTADIMNTEDPMLLDTDNGVLAPSPDKKSNNSPDEKSEIVSPVVVKRSRNSKRRFMGFSSNRKNKLENEDCGLDADLDFDFPRLKTVTTGSVNVNSTQNQANVTECIRPLDPVDQSDKTLLELSPEVLNETIRHYPTNNEEPSPEFLNKSAEVRRSLSFASKFSKLNDCATQSTLTSLESKNKIKEDQPQSVEKPLNSLNVNVINNDAPSSKLSANKTAKKEKKTKWELKKSREPSNNNKFKQTLLSTVAVPKKLDISTLDEYTGGLVPAEKQSDVGKHCDKENFNETYFDPRVTSTSNELLMQPKTPVKNLVDDSFDVIPNTSPNYKYRRDAIRRKSERQKLPGQDCPQCFNFYEDNTQANKLLNKCSRHRDKFAIMANTPPGLWNPGFDTDEEMDK